MFFHIFFPRTQRRRRKISFEGYRRERIHECLFIVQSENISFENVSGRWNESEKNLISYGNVYAPQDVNNECCVWYANSIHKKSLTQLTKIFFHNPAHAWISIHNPFKNILLEYGKWRHKYKKRVTIMHAISTCILSTLESCILGR